MKIGFEAQRIFRAHKHGMDLAALELIRRLQQTDRENQYLLFAADGPDKTSLLKSQNLHPVFLRGLSYADREQIFLPAAVKRNHVDLLHCTANTAPVHGNTPLILTLHDIIFLDNDSLGGSLYQDIGNLYRRWVTPAAIRRASTIITVSEHERNNIVARFPSAEQKTIVIYNGVDERFHDNYTAAERERVSRRYGLPAQYILFLGNTSPKKNTAAMIKAYVHLREQFDEAPPLVITDYPRSLVTKHLAALKKEEVIRSIIPVGYISPVDMPLLYAGSSCFVYPSLAESFGLPIVEAMACGTPVLTSNLAAMPEVAGGAALLVDPRDPAAIADGMYRLLTDDVMRTEFVEKGRERARAFSWDVAASRLRKVYSDHQH